MRNGRLAAGTLRNVEGDKREEALFFVQQAVESKKSKGTAEFLKKGRASSYFSVSGNFLAKNEGNAQENKKKETRFWCAFLKYWKLKSGKNSRFFHFKQ